MSVVMGIYYMKTPRPAQNHVKLDTTLHFRVENACAVLHNVITAPMKGRVLVGSALFFLIFSVQEEQFLIEIEDSKVPNAFHIHVPTT